MKIVLFEPQIPQNCGNIVRTCAVTGNELVLVKPLGFSITDRWLKRAGLDYWLGASVSVAEGLEEVLASEAAEDIVFLSSHATALYTKVGYRESSVLIFGSETSGLPDSYRRSHPGSWATIPMRPKQRCLNLATSVGIVVYEAWRQQGFAVNVSDCSNQRT